MNLLQGNFPPEMPAVVDPHLEVIDFNKDGEMLLCASDMTGRTWGGSMWLFRDVLAAPDIEKCVTGAKNTSSIADAKWIDAKTFLVGTDSGSMEMWRVSKPASRADAAPCVIECLWTRNAHDDLVHCVEVMTSAGVRSSALSASADRSIQLWDLDAKRDIADYRVHAAAVVCVAAHPNASDMFLSCSQDGSLYVWDKRMAKPAREIIPGNDDAGSVSHPTCAAWQPGQQYQIAVGDRSGKVTYRDLREQMDGIVATANTHNRWIHRMRFSPKHHSLLATVSDDCMVAVTKYSGISAEPVYRDKKHRDFVHGLAWHPTTHQLHTCSWDHTVLAHKVTSKK